MSSVFCLAVSIIVSLSGGSRWPSVHDPVFSSVSEHLVSPVREDVQNSKRAIAK